MPMNACCWMPCWGIQPCRPVMIWCSYLGRCWDLSWRSGRSRRLNFRTTLLALGVPKRPMNLCSERVDAGASLRLNKVGGQVKPPGGLRRAPPSAARERVTGRWIIAHCVEPWGSLSGRVLTQKRCVERTLPGFRARSADGGCVSAHPSRLLLPPL
jgi:hypothetical protein